MQEQGQPWSNQNFTHMHRVVLLLLFTKCLLGSFPFDLGKLKQINGPKVITNDPKRLVREFGAKRPLEDAHGNGPDAVKTESLTAKAVIEIVAPPPAMMPMPEMFLFKRKFSKVTPKMTPEEIINNEINFGTRILSTRLGVFRTTIQFIAENNLEGFLANEAAFKYTFKKSYKEYSRNGIRKYLITFAIMFGAHDIVHNYVSLNYCDYNKDIGDVLPDLTKYLFSNKPFGICMKTVLKFSSYSAKICDDLREELTRIVNARFPALDYFERLAFEIFLSGSGVTKMTELFEPITELKKAELLSEISSNYHLTGGGNKLIQQFPLQQTEMYLQMNDINRFGFIESVLSTDDDGLLNDIFEIDLEIASAIVKKPGHRLFSYSEYSSAFIVAVDLKAYKCFDLLLDMFEEVLKQEKIDTFEARFCPVRLAILSAALAHNDARRFKFIEILESKGLTMDTTFPSAEHYGRILDTRTTMLQYALFTHNSPATEYFFRKTELQRARNEIYSIWTTDNELVKHLITNFKDNVTKMITDAFGINLNAKVFVNDQGKRGNISIFLPADHKATRASNLNVTLPYSRKR